MLSKLTQSFQSIIKFFLLINSPLKSFFQISLNWDIFNVHFLKRVFSLLSKFFACKRKFFEWREALLLQLWRRGLLSKCSSSFQKRNYYSLQNNYWKKITIKILSFGFYFSARNYPISSLVMTLQPTAGNSRWKPQPHFSTLPKEKKTIVQIFIIILHYIKE